MAPKRRLYKELSGSASFGDMINFKFETTRLGRRAVNSGFEKFYIIRDGLYLPTLGV